MRQGEYDPLRKLPGHGCRDIRVGIPQGDSGEAVREINVLVAVDIPDPATLAPFDEMRRYATRVLCVALGKRLCAERNRPQCSVQHLLGSIVSAHSMEGLAFASSRRGQVWSAPCARPGLS